MKKLIYLILIGLASSCAFGQAQLGLHLWTITLKVVDDNNRPVEGAQAWVAYDSAKQGQSTDPIQSSGWAKAGMTDTNGTFTATHTDRSWTLGIHIQKLGYYSTYATYEMCVPGQLDAQKVATNRNATLLFVFKKIINPIPMYAKRLNTHVPDLDKPVGFDLMAGDWVAPYGNGFSADINFTGRFNKRVGGESDYTLTVNFPKKGDGIQEFRVPSTRFPNEGSQLRSLHEASVDGYLFEWIQTDNRKPGKPVETNRDLNRNYFFRVRTVLDENGNVKSALYGKIYGDFMNFRYYLNPTPNDRNVEFDPKRNLMKNLKPGEGVSEP